jgi:hypothetical protein
LDRVRQTASWSVCALIPEAGARCGSSARRDLRWGCRETGIPTATSQISSVKNEDLTSNILLIYKLGARISQLSIVSMKQTTKKTIVVFTIISAIIITNKIVAKMFFQSKAGLQSFALSFFSYALAIYLISVLSKKTNLLKIQSEDYATSYSFAKVIMILLFVLTFLMVVFLLFTALK